jgi:hypothetical protein
MSYVSDETAVDQTRCYIVYATHAATTPIRFCGIILNEPASGQRGRCHIEVSPTAHNGLIALEDAVLEFGG